MELLNNIFQIAPFHFERVRTRGKHFFNSKRYTTKKRELAAHVARELRKAGRFKPSQNPIELDLLFLVPKPKKPAKHLREFPLKPPDCSNCAKAVEDSMNGILYKDDCQIISLKARKVYGDTPSIQIVAKEIETGAEHITQTG